MAVLSTNAPITGGIVPTGAIGNQLAAITRRAVVPSLFVQVYNALPMLSILLSNAQRARGGVGQITIPTQGSSFVNFSWSSFAGNFNLPTDQAAIQNAQFNLKLGLCPIGFFGMEAIVQSSEVIIPKLRAVTSDAAVVIKQALAQALYANNSADDSKLDSLFSAYDDGTNVDVYGGISRAAQANSYWDGQLVTNAGGIANRAGMASLLTRIQTRAGGEAPDYCIMNPADWANLMVDFMNYEQYIVSPRSQFGKDDSISTGFSAIKVLNTSFFLDPYVPLGEAFFVNSRYLGMYVSEYAPFVFSGFESAIPLGQIASIGVLIVALNLVCAKPSSGAHVTGITGGQTWATAPTVSVP